MTVDSWQLAVDSWQLAVGSWQLAVGNWQLLNYQLLLIKLKHRYPETGFFNQNTG
ncbi:MAG: hypothetical protein JGK24_27640 [Microcoleus sp. PH2017_29_MFU_D_A]|uniref:hypothetical protein n=1 Tax=unclassified Microcoleus TaxID=2642155 RepID=UPI001DEADAB3|nr:MULTISPECIES: hypothetical protein [unclassified Microcoleus]MCC3417291.1 hypothetical protein [Microcoleus sp. PH2017_07_MST_O_A]MCC3513337.1 hypothetical protein [Microcoleus sp. PH2017_17_BER_D_A]MCC3457726.1 hypothetical protein [Microcoleus sp. PH2017_08_TRC_O_A]MCC3516031.1 hypothetical protein [Microcoleus sp. PH2017_18_LLB_O_A]MCC3534798.1 hypothetical protein [Microcoleus sp. PH2017_25_DOB_D_A]